MIKYQFLRKNIINENKSLIDVVQSLNSAEEKICIILSGNKKVRGVITDGDLRRLLLKQKNLNVKIKNHFKKKFIYLNDSCKLKEVEKKFLVHQDIFYIPILTKSKKLIGVYTRRDILKEKDLTNEAFILAGGLGKRLHTLTDFFPKPMLSVGSRPLLESIIYSLKSSGFKKINISVNYLQHKIKNYFKDGRNFDLHINYFSEKKKLGTAGPLYFLKKKKLKKTIIVMNGDLYTNLKMENLINFHDKEKNDFTMCCHTHTIQVPYGVIDLKKKSKMIINEKPKISYLVSSGIYALNPDLLRFIPNNKYFDMNDFINLVKIKNKKIGLFNVHENLYDIGDYNKLMEARGS